MYEKNYTALPIFNRFNYSTSSEIQQSNSFSFFVPPGNYSLSLNITSVQYSEPLTVGKDSGKNYTLQLGSALAIPFEVSRPYQLKGISVSASYNGSTYLSGIISNSFGHVSFSRPSSGTTMLPYFDFNNATLYPNTPYYFWLFPDTTTPRNSGSIILPISSSSGYAFEGNVNSTSVTNISRVNFTVPLTLFVNSSSPKPIVVSAEFNGVNLNPLIGGDTNFFKDIEISQGGPISFSVSTNMTDYLAYQGSSISIAVYVKNVSMPTFFLLDNPSLILVGSLAVTLAGIFIVNIIDFKQRRVQINHISKLIALLAFIMYWGIFALGYLGIIPILYNFTVFKTVGVVLAVSFLVALISYDWH